jgi:SPP1 gp7 family putative phage head morphogenesis protein
VTSDRVCNCAGDTRAVLPLGPDAVMLMRPARGYRASPGVALGVDLNAAIRALGGDTRLPATRAQGYALVADTGRLWAHGGRFLRLPPGTNRHAALDAALRAAVGGPVVLCKAVESIGPLVLFRDVARFEKREVLDVLRAAQDAAEDLLAGCFRVNVRKAINPLSRGGFDFIVSRIARRLRGAAAGSEEKALREAVRELDVDWPALTPEGREAAVQAMRLAVGRAPENVLPRISEVLSVEADRVVRGARKGAKETLQLRIAASLNETDKRIAKHVAASQANFVRNEFWRRADGASQKAREIVSRGIDHGLGRDDIAHELSSEIAAMVVGRSEFYWEVVASAFVGRARSFALLSSFGEAGIERYVFSAVLDERTTDVCRFMDGKVFPVGAGLDLFNRVDALENPEDIKQVQPWVRTGVDEWGKRVLFVDRGGGSRTTVARVVESAVGQRDEVGRFSKEMSPRDLETSGLVIPPLHGLCRSSLLPVL